MLNFKNFIPSVLQDFRQGILQDQGVGTCQSPNGNFAGAQQGERESAEDTIKRPILKDRILMHRSA
jgi:hypothetical protein